MITRMPFHKSFQDGITIFASLFAALIGTALSSEEAGKPARAGRRAGRAPPASPGNARTEGVKPVREARLVATGGD